MNELKEHLFCECDECIREYRGPLSNEMRPYYLKSEADNVIAELEESHKMEVGQLLMEIAELKKQVHDYALGLYVIQAKAGKELRHSNYKRCLAMARWCRMHDEFTQLESERLGLPQRTIFLEYRRKAMWFNKWHKCWLALADKFKEAK